MADDGGLPIEAAANRSVVSMKTSKRKRSSKSEPVQALDSAPAAAASAEPAAVQVLAAEPANEAVVVSEPVAVEVSAPVEATPAEPVIVLAANCSVKDAAALKSSLCAFVNESAAVTLDTSGVERVDTATMQLLCAFVQDRSARNQSVLWRGVSQALNDAVRLLGVAALLGFNEEEGVAA
jgi:ABC-type transporter Mla MlaB component